MRLICGADHSLSLSFFPSRPVSSRHSTQKSNDRESEEGEKKETKNQTKYSNRQENVINCVCMVCMYECYGLVHHSCCCCCWCCYCYCCCCFCSQVFLIRHFILFLFDICSVFFSFISSSWLLTIFQFLMRTYRETESKLHFIFVSHFVNLIVVATSKTTHLYLSHQNVLFFLHLNIGRKKMVHKYIYIHIFFWN